MASVNSWLSGHDPAAVRRHRASHRSLERAVLLLTIAGGLPAALALFYLTWSEGYSFEVRWTLTALVLLIWVGAAVLAYQMVQRVLFGALAPIARRRGYRATYPSLSRTTLAPRPSRG